MIFFLLASPCLSPPSRPCLPSIILPLFLPSPLAPMTDVYWSNNSLPHPHLSWLSCTFRLFTLLAPHHLALKHAFDDSLFLASPLPSGYLVHLQRVTPYSHFYLRCGKTLVMLCYLHFLTGLAELWWDLCMFFYKSFFSDALSPVIFCFASYNHTL